MPKLSLDVSQDTASRFNECLRHFDATIAQAKKLGANVKMNMSTTDALLLMGIEGYESGIESLLSPIKPSKN